MTQGFVNRAGGSASDPTFIAIGGANTDAFSRLRTSEPKTLFDGQLTHDLQPLLYEQLTAEAGATVAHDTTERAALMTFASTPTGGVAAMQTYEWFRYQPGKSQLVFITFNLNGGVANTIKYAEYGDGANNGIGFRMNGTTPEVYIRSNTSTGDVFVAQASWNDTLLGSGASGLTLDVTKIQIFVIDFQALYAGRVRVGFDIGGVIVYVYEFNHANIASFPYIQNASLPIRCGMTCSGTVSTTMLFICATVISEGGQDPAGYTFIQRVAVTATTSGVHAISIRPRTTFNGIENRTKFAPDSVDLIVTGSNTVFWDAYIGQAITGASYANVNTSFSTMEVSTAGTISGSPAVWIDGGGSPASTQSKGAVAREVGDRYPITLDAAGAVRANGTLTYTVTSQSGTSACYLIIRWREVR